MGDGVFVVTGNGFTTLVASLSPQRRQLVARCTSARPVRADLRGLAGPWPRRLPNVTAMVLCSSGAMPPRVTISFARMRDPKGRARGDSMIISALGRPLVRVTATPTGGGVWFAPTGCFRSVGPT